jgi:hypothetical protein
VRPLETSLVTLTRAGFSALDVRHLYRSFGCFRHGHVLVELRELVHSPDETDDLLRFGLHRLPLRWFPLLRSLAPDLTAHEGAIELERGLDILISGLEAQKVRTTPRRRPCLRRSARPLSSAVGP